MDGYKFVVDKNLVIISWEMKRGSSRGTEEPGYIGVPYYEVVPRILHDNADAVEMVILDGRPRSVKDYHAMCIFGCASGEVTVSPVLDDNRKVVGAEVRADGFSHCTVLDCWRAEPDNLEMGKKSVTLAHGVRSPLNAIKGAAVYLKGKYSADPGLVEFMNIIEDEISKLDRFVTKFLSTSLVESEFTRVDISAMLRKIVALVSLQATAKNISISSDLKDLPLIKADECLFEHAVLNVINNSIEALEDGGAISVTAEQVPRDDREYVVIEISDNGYGMNSSSLQGVSGGSQGRRKTSGRGFGLFITREVVQYHGGQLEIDSRRNSGTRVRILVPVSAP
ncbi:MAG: HAMP domain-containing sensor histidine kinase [Geobacteraceae bacterium]|nr:HAMP domain-containing sensor histidine kinase [Geobacteraceae bacterium]